MEYTATLTSKGQITIPLAIRKLLNLENGDKLNFFVQGQEIVLRCSEKENDPAIEAFLSLIGKDITEGKNILPLTEDFIPKEFSGMTANEVRNLTIDEDVEL